MPGLSVEPKYLVLVVGAQSLLAPVIPGGQISVKGKVRAHQHRGIV